MWRNGPFFPRDTWFVPSPHDRISSVILMYTLEYRSQRKKRTEATVNANLEHLTDTTTTVRLIPRNIIGLLAKLDKAPDYGSGDCRSMCGGPPAQRRTQLTAPLGFRRHAALPAPGDAAAGALLEAALTAQRGPWLASALVPVAVDDLAAARAGRPAHAPGGGVRCKDIELICDGICKNGAKKIPCEYERQIRYDNSSRGPSRHRPGCG
ncbi:hypothetical protein PAPYR_9185 [Paratrimastix pyriformis]|uniref:Uncharacterized protein n=1 Tax=Paratrimastix pyriformis TaxID=342808 RepID=A0ABQ8UG28_9EUKA|nr:hypothetical protein PAPYR_9185 [Paratrimastix pyriformis]